MKQAEKEEQIREKMAENSGGLQPWLLCVDNILLDVAYEMPNNKLWQEVGVEPGLQYTATNEKLTKAALKVLKLSEGEYGCKLVSRTPGGCALNAARAANFYLKSLQELGTDSNICLENRVLNMGCVGADEPAETIIKCHEDEGVLHDLHREPTALTGVCAVTIVDSARTCIGILDACEKYPTSHMKRVLSPNSPTLDSLQCLYTTGFFSEVNKEAVLLMAQHALNHDKIFAYNFAAESQFKDYKKEYLEILPYCDFVICNADEAAACHRYMGVELGMPMGTGGEEESIEKSEENLKMIAEKVVCSRKINKKRPRVMVITNSEKKVVVAVGPSGSEGQGVLSFDVELPSLD